MCTGMGTCIYSVGRAQPLVRDRNWWTFVSCFWLITTSRCSPSLTTLSTSPMHHLSRVSIGLNFVKLPCLSGRMTKLSPMETQGKLPSLLSYRDLDVKLPGRKGSRKLERGYWHCVLCPVCGTFYQPFRANKLSFGFFKQSLLETKVEFIFRKCCWKVAQWPQTRKSRAQIHRAA